MTAIVHLPPYTLLLLFFSVAVAVHRSKRFSLWIRSTFPHRTTDCRKEPKARPIPNVLNMHALISQWALSCKGQAYKSYRTLLGAHFILVGSPFTCFPF
ncbi:hypothetical protein ES332_D06G006900v1 [Gossypium tomentosum]|uniref:Secreted protein n=1 Tax=Gossypium tomentosum TaxID=34277 RepID=A0A5D2KCD5_GOSTO|nr:hypothetical protein ES332_D06G006900v1 [Gossypium tomentosum]